MSSDAKKLNDQLYAKMTAEQEKYRTWLLSQPAEEILNHACEYTMREDILMSVETNHLTAQQAAALLASPDALADLFHKLRDIDTDYMDTIHDCVTDYANEQAYRQQKELRNTPVYRESGTYASRHDEKDEYIASYKANIACKQTLEQAINGNYADNQLNVSAALRQAAELFGMERVVYVLAVTVRAKDWDGRIMPDNKAWAKTIPVAENLDAWSNDRNLAFVVDQAHTGLIDILVSHVRKELMREQPPAEKRPSVMDKLKKASPLETKAPAAEKKPDLEL
ncbi:MAG: DUF3849 domain-containing protein [Oscillospiraceae bacterium]|nr:DUF3849 domain-containing protein [Oscillospiraceae bacterium]